VNPLLPCGAMVAVAPSGRLRAVRMAGSGFIVLKVVESESGVGPQ
jgi:hypothetical protein